jgi:hypothetical protein
MLVSVRQLAARGTLLEPTLSQISHYLAGNPRNEVLLLNTGIQPPTVEVICEGTKDEEDLEPFSKPTGGLVAVSFTWEQEFFVDAKMPNEDGAGLSVVRIDLKQRVKFFLSLESQAKNWHCTHDPKFKDC